MSDWSPRKGDVVVPADGSTFCGRVTLVTHAKVHYVCLDTGQTYEKSRLGFLTRYCLLRASPTAHTVGYTALDQHFDTVMLKHHPFASAVTPEFPAFPIALEDDEWEEP